MKIAEARLFIVRSSLTATVLLFAFSLFAPLFGFPLSWDQVQRLIEIVLPVFLGYLATAVHYTFRDKRSQPEVELGPDDGLISLLIRGPVVIFLLISVFVIIAFGYSNRANAQQDSGMSMDSLTWWLTAALGILTISTSVAVSYLFAFRTDGPSRTPPV